MPRRKPDTVKTAEPNYVLLAIKEKLAAAHEVADIVSQDLHGNLTQIEALIASLETPPALVPLKSVDEGIELLGGPTKLAEYLGLKQHTVSGWKDDGFFATNTFYALRPRFEALGREATPRLWRMREPAQ